MEEQNSRSNSGNFLSEKGRTQAGSANQAGLSGGTCKFKGKRKGEDIFRDLLWFVVNATILKVENVAFQVFCDFFCCCSCVGFAYWLISEFQNLSCKSFFFFKVNSQILVPRLHWTWKECCCVHTIVWLYLLLFFLLFKSAGRFFFFEVLFWIYSFLFFFYLPCLKYICCYHLKH